jgi:hypothetical protein
MIDPQPPSDQVTYLKYLLFPSPSSRTAHQNSASFGQLAGNIEVWPWMIVSQAIMPDQSGLSGFEKKERVLCEVCEFPSPHGRDAVFVEAEKHLK